MLRDFDGLENTVDLVTGRLRRQSAVTRRMQDLADLFADAPAARELVCTGGDPVVYEVFLDPSEGPPHEEQLLYGTTVLYPGQVAGEYFMTKGHFHEHADSPEVYLGLSGEGALLLMDEAGETRSVPMGPGGVGYIPPGAAHRTMNTGRVPFVFFAVWPRRAGHDYERVARRGFSHRLVEQNGVPTLIPNPEWSR